MSATIVLTIVSIISPMVSGICEMCVSDCYDLNDDLPVDGGVATCQDFGDDIGNICYFTDEDSPSGGNSWEEARICTADRQCAQRFHYPHCLRCCPNADNAPNSLCTQTASSGRDNCGVINEYIGRMTNDYYSWDGFFSDAPCCDGDECLDGIAGICGEPVSDECGRCTMWSYLIGEEAGGVYYDYPHYFSESFADLPLGYTTGDDCDTGMVCVKDSRSDNIDYKPEYNGNDDRRRRLQEELESRRRLSSPFIFNFGFCVPENGVSDISDVCSDDNECPSCMRCCNGQCMRTTGEYECGLEGRGSCCCSTDECCFNECVTPTKNPTKNPTKKPTKNPTKNPIKHDASGDNNDHSGDDQVFGAEFGGVNDRVVDNDIKPVEYTVSLGGNLNNLYIFGALLILLICGCIVAYYWCGKNNTKVQQSFQNDIDQISNM